MLLDNNFASIVSAVLWGRNVYCNITRFLQASPPVRVQCHAQLKQQCTITVGVGGPPGFLRHCSPPQWHRVAFCLGRLHSCWGMLDLGSAWCTAPSVGVLPIQ